jgi:DNA-binding beta-propeller fold protein YncE
LLIAEIQQQPSHDVNRGNAIAAGGLLVARQSQWARRAPKSVVLSLLLSQNCGIIVTELAGPTPYDPSMKCLTLTFCLLTAIALALGAVRAAGAAENYESTSETVGWETNGFETPVNQLLTPAGKLVELPRIRPNALALSPDCALLVTSGLKAELLVLDPATGEILQSVPMPSDQQHPGIESLSSEILAPNLKDKLSFTGLAFSPDGRRIYLSNVNGDIKVFSVGKDKKVSPLFSIPLPPANRPGRKDDIPTGIAVSLDGAKIYVALNVANRLAEINAATGEVLRTWDVGVAPYGVALAGKKIYVSNWGGRRPEANSVVGPIGRNGIVRVDARSVASEGSVSIIDLNSESSAATAEILTGLHACALALSPNGKFLVCANAGGDTLSVLDTRTDKIVETIFARQKPGDPFGAQPDALSFDRRGGRLYVCNGSQNAVAVFQFKPGKSKLLGLIPVGWFPGAIAYDARRDEIDVANIISVTRKMEAPAKGRSKGIGQGFNTKQYCGSLSLVPLPSHQQLEKFTQTALANLRYPLLARAKLPARENRPPQPVPERVGEPGVFEHILYIIKENRTYDQVLGDVKEGNGNADLCIFGQRVTPNQHKFVSDFALLDNTYCSGLISSEGHQWTDSALADDYIQRSYAGWPRSYPGGGSDPNGRDSMAYASTGFIWDDAIAHGKTVCDFGELTTGRHYWKDSHREENNWLDSYRDFVGRSNAIVYSAEADLESLRPYIMTNYIGFDLRVPDVFRAAQFIKDLGQFERTGSLPNLIVLWLPDDHTSGTQFGEPQPEAQVADNDLAFGQIVEAVSHSRFWTNTCIFAVEDDPQDGWDHVSGYRTTAYVISPYTKRRAVVSTQYNQTSLLRTIELMLGLPPMNQMDATATPMFDCFTNTPDFTVFDALTNQVPLDEMNPNPKRISDSALRKDAYVSARLPLDKEDQCPEDLFNHILWRAAKGSRAPYPDWAAKTAGDDD